MLSFLYWDPSPALFNYNLPLLGRPILWYGFLFALGFLLGYFVLLHLLKRIPSLPVKPISDKIVFHMLVGAIAGARLGDVLFYQTWTGDFGSIFRFWEGGLASHGGAIGILISLAILARRIKELSFLRLLDLVVIPTALAAGFIRIGNFFNQEILGTVSTLPWAVVFGHAADGSLPQPRHPVQLYEAFFYFSVFLFLFLRKRVTDAPGRIAGLFLMIIFAFRFLIEFIKEEQSAWVSSGHLLTMGQYLSLPLMALGLLLWVRARRAGSQSGATAPDNSFRPKRETVR